VVLRDHRLIGGRGHVDIGEYRELARVDEGLVVLKRARHPAIENDVGRTQSVHEADQADRNFLCLAEGAFFQHAVEKGQTDGDGTAPENRSSIEDMAIFHARIPISW
jgi:hypothetical protein